MLFALNRLFLAGSLMSDAKDTANPSWVFKSRVLLLGVPLDFPASLLPSCWADGDPTAPDIVLQQHEAACRREKVEKSCLST